VDLERMLANARRDQWRIEDLDWSQKPRALTKDDEIAIVQLFTDMAGIERLAGALFAEQILRTEEPVLKEIFKTFVVDEIRHAETAELLARFYDVHHFKHYRLNANLVKFRPHFLLAIKYLSDDVANAYITSGELILDVALLRSINDYVDDAMSAAAMRLINRDESRHIAIDYHMVEYYASPAYAAKEREQPKTTSVRERAMAAWTMAAVLWFAKPFFRDVFFDPMARVDPTGTRLREAFRRIQLLGAKPGVRDRPFSKFMAKLQELYLTVTTEHPRAGKLVGDVLARAAGLEPQFLQRLVTDDDERRARSMTFDELAEDALRAKDQSGV
jgi:hypothetical protein